MVINSRDRERVIELHYIHRFTIASIARLFGVSHVTIINITSVHHNDLTLSPDIECLLCGLEDVHTFYIDGNDQNKNPQNIIMLCEACKRRMQHRQLKRRDGSLKPQF